MPLPARIVTLLVAFLVVVGLGVFVSVYYIGANPPTVNYTTVASHGSVNVVLQEDPQNTVSARPDWVSYFVQDPSTHQWVHTTYFQVPKNTLVHITILGYDGCTPLRNNYFSQIQGTIGNTVTVQQFKTVGQPLGPAKRVGSIDSWASCSVAHTFAIPGLHLFVPVASPNTALFNKEACGVSPCTEGPHSVETFSFRTPDSTGTFRWQCLVPCGGGFLDGNGGPMQTLGYMTGNMEVTA